MKQTTRRQPWRQLVALGAPIILLAACGTRTAAPATRSPAAVVGSSRAASISSTLPSSAQPASPNQSSAPRTSSPSASAASEKPVAPESNPPGDIPDSQVFVKFTSSAGGYQLDVPEGWARTEQGADVTFVSKLDGVQVSMASASSPPTASSVQNDQVPALQKTGRAVTVDKVQQVQLPAGPAVITSYNSNSDPNAVTGKQVRLENNTYFFYKAGKLAALRLWAPQGADNVDQWQHMAQSFSWG